MPRATQLGVNRYFIYIPVNSDLFSLSTLFYWIAYVYVGNTFKYYLNLVSLSILTLYKDLENSIGPKFQQYI